MAMMLVTRPEPDASDTIARLSALDIEAIGLPLLERAPLATSLPDAHKEALAAMRAGDAQALAQAMQHDIAQGVDQVRAALQRGEI